jgi:hypothetical protein
MSRKFLLAPARLRRPPARDWSWVDRRFVREHAAHLSRDAVLLYFFLSAVADRRGLSFHGSTTLATLLGMTLPALIHARDELMARDLIAHEAYVTQVLSLPPHGEPGQGSTRPGEAPRQAITSTHHL